MVYPLRLLLLGLLPLATIARADVRLPAIFQDHMVLQQDMPDPLWGWAAPGEKITLSLAGEKLTTTADASGRFRFKLPVLKCSDQPLELTLQGANTLTLHDVLVGEVWLGSGQSNMEWSVANCPNAKEALAASANPQLRLFKADKTPALTPQEDLKGHWVEASPESVKSFASVLYFMGRDLHQKLHQPVGLVEAAWGGTIIQAWSRYESLTTDPFARLAAEKQAKELNDPAWLQKEYEHNLARYEKEMASWKTGQPKPRKAELRTPLYNNRASVLFNGMIAPLAGYGLRGAVWYQGEFNAGEAEHYQRWLPMMITDWRKAWGQGDFPFLIVQLPGIGEKQTALEEHVPWARLREAQLKALAVPHTALTVTVDIGDGELHPRNKEPFGQRVALAALKLGYGQALVCSGPFYQSMAVENNAIRLRFSAGDGVDPTLVLKNPGPISSFSIAGEDHQFHTATARIDGSTLLVSSPDVAHPVAVRYGWAQHPTLELYGASGLPASPFRTDDWPMKK